MFIRAMVRIFSFGERWNVPFNEATAELNGTFHLSPNANSQRVQRIPLHSWEMEFSNQYHVTINSQLNDQNSIRYYIIQDLRS
jgi:hypothetical protein